MESLERWLSVIDETVLEVGREGSLDILTPPSVDLSRTVALSGFPGVLPLWSGNLQTVGLLARPAAAPRTWRPVVVARGQALTLATDPGTLLPQLIVHRVLSKLPEAAERLAQRWSKIGPKVSALHRVLGGSDDSLSAAIEAVRNPETRAEFTFRSGHEAKFEAAHSRLAREIDRSEEFRRYADWLDACIEGKWTAVEAPERYGSWGRRVLCWANRLRYKRPTVLTLPTAWMVRVVEEDAGIDSGLPKHASWAARPGAASGETALLEAARFVAKQSSSGDPVADGLVNALTTEGNSYQGYTHAEAVVALDERGEPERAWGALQSAAWWAARGTGTVPDAMLEGAKFLAVRRDWGDVLWVVERTMKVGDARQRHEE